MELTSAIREYTEKKIETLEKVMKSSPEVINIEIGKTTNHHKQGDVYKAELNMAIGGYKFHTESEEEDLYAAIDAVREDMFRQGRTLPQRRCLTPPELQPYHQLYRHPRHQSL